jgi:cytochrome c oxidase subunit 3
VFFLLTGLHGVHVFVGTVLLALCYAKLAYYTGGFAKVSAMHRHPALLLKCSMWYWHFVDVVWIFLYVFLYVFSQVS